MWFTKTITETNMGSKKKAHKETLIVNESMSQGPAPKPKIKASYGFECDGKIYKTIQEATRAYQIEEIKRKFPCVACSYGADEYRRTGVLFVKDNWDTLIGIMHDKLEVE